MSNFSLDTTFEEAVNILKQKGFDIEYPMVRVGNSVEEAKTKLDDGIKWYFKQRGLDYSTFVDIKYTAKNGVEYEPYKEIADWLHDNHGKSLLLYGGCGLGKTMIAYYILPVILQFYSNPKWVLNTFSASDLHKPGVIDEAMKYRCVCIDDVGVENKIVNYGQTLDPILDIVDSIEKRGRLVIFTSNLPSASAIEQRYGTRVLDRIKSNFKRVLFSRVDSNGNQISLRPND